MGKSVVLCLEPVFDVVEAAALVQFVALCCSAVCRSPALDRRGGCVFAVVAAYPATRTYSSVRSLVTVPTLASRLAITNLMRTAQAIEA